MDDIIEQLLNCVLIQAGSWLLLDITTPISKPLINIAKYFKPLDLKYIFGKILRTYYLSLIVILKEKDVQICHIRLSFPTYSKLKTTDYLSLDSISNNVHNRNCVMYITAFLDSSSKYKYEDWANLPILYHPTTQWLQDKDIRGVLRHTTFTTIVVRDWRWPSGASVISHPRYRKHTHPSNSYLRLINGLL